VALKCFRDIPPQAFSCRDLGDLLEKFLRDMFREAHPEGFCDGIVEVDRAPCPTQDFQATVEGDMDQPLEIRRGGGGLENRGDPFHPIVQSGQAGRLPSLVGDILQFEEKSRAGDRLYLPQGQFRDEAPPLFRLQRGFERGYGLP
jgi:hypothetical protein